MRTVYLGTSEFAAAVLRRLADSPHRPVLVVTRPDRPRGRGRKLRPAPGRRDRARARDRARPARVRQRRGARWPRSPRRAPEAVCVCAFGALIKEPLLSAYEMLNVHPSLLPRWRGAAPIERAIMGGDERTGRVDHAAHRGPRLRAGLRPGGRADRAGGHLRHAGGASRGSRGGPARARRSTSAPPCAEQDEALATYADKSRPRTGSSIPPRRLSSSSARCARSRPTSARYVALEEGSASGCARPGPAAGGPPAGELSLDGTRPVLGCAEGALELLVVQPPGRRAMSGEDYLRGRRR